MSTDTPPIPELKSWTKPQSVSGKQKKDQSKGNEPSSTGSSSSTKTNDPTLNRPSQFEIKPQTPQAPQQKSDQISEQPKNKNIGFIVVWEKIGFDFQKTRHWLSFTPDISVDQIRHFIETSIKPTATQVYILRGDSIV